MLGVSNKTVSKRYILTMLLLIIAFLGIITALDSLIFAGNRYDDVSLTVNGVAEVDAVYNFGTRCIIPEIKKFTSTIIKGMTKGNSELTVMMQEQSKEVWQLKKQLVRREGEKAASKLLIPICIMFVGILIMILIPIFTNLGA